jgi:hypothetical protein
MFTINIIKNFLSSNPAEILKNNSKILYAFIIKYHWNNLQTLWLHKNACTQYYGITASFSSAFS